MTITAYKTTRVRGMAPWRPQAKARELVEHVLTLLEEDRDYLPLTNRQILYRLVGKDVISKKDDERLYETLNRARRAGLIPFDAIRTDGQTEQVADSFDDVDDFWLNVSAWADSYVVNRQAGQPQYLEVWCEAGGMVPQLRRVCDPFTIPVYSSGGFDSVTAKHTAARRFLRRGVRTVVLHIGDHDPSGIALFESMADDVLAFCRDLGGDECVDFLRAAVTPDQIDSYGLPELPANPRDRRGDWTGGTVQAEALTPADLAAELRRAIELYIDATTYAAAVEREEVDRGEILATVDVLRRKSGGLA